MARIGIVGHRYFCDQSVVAFISQQCFGLLEQFKALDPALTTISAIAEGADTIFAEAALKLDLPLEIVLPFRDYVSDFPTEDARERYRRLRAAACTEKILPYATRSDEAYEAAMNWVIMQADLLIAVWDGLPSGGTGGTGYAVQQAIELNQPWIHLNTRNQFVIYHW
jgi:hypothetical protein